MMANNWWRSITGWLGKGGARPDGPESNTATAGETLSRESVRQMVEGILTTRPDEIGCDECFEEMGQFADFTLAGKSAQEALPLVHDHLQRCPDCREEYEALLLALKSSS